MSPASLFAAKVSKNVRLASSADRVVGRDAPSQWLPDDRIPSTSLRAVEPPELSERKGI